MTRMIKPVTWGLASMLVLSACTFGSSEPSALRASSTSPSATAVSPTPVESPLPSPSPATDAFIPSPGRRIPRDPAVLARDLVRTTYALRDAIDAWTEDADPTKGGPPVDVVLMGLYQQRIYRLLARDENLYERILPRLEGRLREHAKANVRPPGSSSPSSVRSAVQAASEPGL